jgi:hypothetical protein
MREFAIQGKSSAEVSALDMGQGKLLINVQLLTRK